MVLDEFTDTAIVNSGRTIHLNQEKEKLECTSPSNHAIAVAIGQISRTSAKANLLLPQLQDEA